MGSDSILSLPTEISGLEQLLQYLLYCEIIILHSQFNKLLWEINICYTTSNFFSLLLSKSLALWGTNCVLNNIYTWIGSRVFYCIIEDECIWSFLVSYHIIILLLQQCWFWDLSLPSAYINTFLHNLVCWPRNQNIDDQVDSAKQTTTIHLYVKIAF